MTAILEARALGLRYGRRHALTDCTLNIPPGRVGGTPGSGTAQLARVGFLAQDAPVYPNLSIADHLRLGRHLNPSWDQAFAERRVAELELDPSQRAGRLSGGQRAQLALTVAIGKGPELLLLDEPVASLDPLARRGFLNRLLESVAEKGLSVILSSHLISDLERVCDYLIVLVSARVRLAGEADRIIAAHHRIVCTRREPSALPAGLRVLCAEHTDRQSTFIVRAEAPLPAGDWAEEPLSMEDLVMTYLEGAESGAHATAQDAQDLR
jgi:ABC-2 type transport system ATP-binding protein